MCVCVSYLVSTTRLSLALADANCEVLIGSFTLPESLRLLRKASGKTRAAMENRK